MNKSKNKIEILMKILTQRAVSWELREKLSGQIEYVFTMGCLVGIARNTNERKKMYEYKLR